VFLRRIKRPEDMSGMMANFFSNLIPEIALIWALSLALFYRRIYADQFQDIEQKIIPTWVVLGFSIFFVMMPVRYLIARSVQDDAETTITY